MPTTPNQGFRYPGPLDPPDGPGGLYNLAMDIDTAFSNLQRRASVANIGSGATPLIGVWPMSLIAIELIAANYTQAYLLFVWQSPFNSGGYVTQLAKTQINNNPGYADPTWSVSNYTLAAAISNAPASNSGITARVIATRIGTNSDAPNL